MQNTFVETACGRVMGATGGGVRRFLGIPYCEPPVGSLRLQPPQPKAAWEGTLDCTRHRPIAPQGPSGLAIPMGPVTREQSEDCLTLTVFAPETGKNLPVAVWLHGGAFYSGAGSLDWYSGENLAREGGMVVVGVNYRIGALGFLRYPGISAGNMAIEDQAEALRWVRRNISRFGGDPGRVTIVGHSVGANSVLHLLSMPETEGLFQQAWLLSPMLGDGCQRREDAETAAREFAAILGSRPGDDGDAAKVLREKTAEDFVRAFAAAAPKLAPRFGRMFLRPVYDEWCPLPALIEKAAAKSVERGMKYVIGGVHDEGLAFSADRSPESMARLAATQENQFDGPTREFVRAACAAGCPIWNYRFDWTAPESVYGACHSVDLPFLFGTFDAWNAPMLAGAAKADMEPLSRIYMGALIRFVREGGFPEEEWPLYTNEKPVRRIFDGSGSHLSSD